MIMNVDFMYNHNTSEDATMQEIGSPSHLLRNCGALGKLLLLGIAFNLLLTAPVLAAEAQAQNTGQGTTEQGTTEEAAKDATEESTEGAAEGQVYKLGAVEVQSRDDQPGQTTLSGEFLKLVPAATGTVTDSLRGQSFIQFDQSSRSAATGGEIAPPRVSIRGSKHYENNFMINGVSNNNNINPAGLPSDTAHSTQPSGEAQNLFLDTSLLKSIEVHTEYVPAQYGGFTGGVINAKIRDARTDRWHIMAHYRHNSDSWTRFHYSKTQEENKDLSTTAELQPRFKHHQFSASLDGPIGENLGLLLFYGRKQSDIPLHSGYTLTPSNPNNREKRDQERLNENYMVRLNLNNIDNFKASLTGIYAPYEHQLFSPQWRDSDYQMESGGYTLMLETENTFSFGKLSNTINYQRNELSRTADSNLLNSWRYRPTNAYANWVNLNASGNVPAIAQAIAYEGGQGDYTQDKTSIGWQGMMEFDTFGPEMFRNSIKAGVEYEHVYVKGKRGAYTAFTGNATTSFSGTLPTVTDKSQGWIAGEQWATAKTEGLEVSRKKSFNSAAAFIEDTIAIGRLTLRPGLRVSTESITGNVDIAPRSFVNLDVLGDNMLNIYGGYNRYYGGHILGYATHIPITTESYTRGAWDASWVLGSSSRNLKNKLGDLDTPYSDEFGVGASLDVWDTLFKIDLVKRNHRDQLRSKIEYPNGTATPQVTYLNNSGASDYWGLTFALEKEYDLGWAGRHTSAFSATRSMLDSNSFDQTAAFSSNADTSDHPTSPAARFSSTYTTYNGSIISLTDMPASNYNAPWVVSYTHTAKFWDDRLRLMGVVRYDVGGKGIARVGNNGLLAPDGLPTQSYEMKRYRDSVNVDVVGEFDVLDYAEHKLTFAIEAYNVFNRKNDTSVYGGETMTNANQTYGLGRQLWGSVRYEF